MAYIEIEIPDAPDRLSLLDRTAYTLLKERLEEDDDPGDALEAATPEQIEEWLLEQSEALADLFRMHAQHFEPVPLKG